MRVLLIYTVCIIKRTAFGTFANDDHAALLGFADTAFHEFDELVRSCGVFRDNSGFRAGGYGRILCQEACVTTHHFDEEDTFVGVGRVADLIHAVHNRVERRVVTNRIVCSVEIVVDCTRKTDTGEVIFFRQEHSTGQRAVTADYDKGINPFFAKCIVRAFSPFGGLKFRRAGCT